MPDNPVTPNDFRNMASQIRDEKQTRENKKHRLNLVKIWKEVDRQLAMIPRERKVSTGDESDWMPNVEIPDQFNALEVILADARSIKFPRGQNWFTALSELSDDYMKRFRDRRERFPIIGAEPVPQQIDQETADTLVKAVLDHYHRLYDFRGAHDLLDAEAIKYGTYVAEVREVIHPKFTIESRGTFVNELRGPAIIPVPIKQCFLDDSPLAVMHEGFVTAPSMIRVAKKRLDDIKRAAKKGGKERGWRVDVVKRLEEPEGKIEHLEMIEFEGDLYVPRSRDTLFLPKVRVLVVVGKGGPAVVRFQESDSSYVVGHYMRQDIESPYGVSPLMKGQPLQEAAAEALNRTMAAAALDANKHVFWDRFDAALRAAGGPEIMPSGNTGVENINSIKFADAGDPEKLFAVFLGLSKKYEDTVGVNDPRRGQSLKSHTTFGAAAIEESRGVARTEDYVEGQRTGSMPTMLYREFDIVKKIMKSPQPIVVNQGGIEGWVNVAAADLPDRVSFALQGAAGPLEQRQKSELFLTATNAIMQMVATAKQLGMRTPELDLEEVYKEAYVNAGEQNADRFIRPAEGLPSQAPVQPGTQGGSSALPSAA